MSESRAVAGRDRAYLPSRPARAALFFRFILRPWEAAMRDTDACGMTYAHYGDIAVCALPFNHDGDCVEANARLGCLEARTRIALAARWNGPAA